MPAVNPASLSPALPVSAPGAVDPNQALQLLEMELARARARRLAREHGAGGSRRTLRALGVLFLLVLMAGGFFAFWRVQELQGEAARQGHSHPAAAPGVPAKRP